MLVSCCGVGTMQHGTHDIIIKIFINQLQFLICKIHAYETIVHADAKRPISVIRNNESMKIVEVNQDVLRVMKRAAWARYDSLIELDAAEQAQLAVEACRNIIASAHTTNYRGDR